MRAVGVAGLLFCLLVPFALMFWAAVRGLSATGNLARDAGWKRVFPGIYLKGPHGGPYVEPDRAQQDSMEATDRPRPGHRHKWPLLSAALVVPIVFPVAGGLISYAQGHTPTPGALVGILAAFLLIGAAWIALGLRAAGSELRSRGDR